MRAARLDLIGAQPARTPDTLYFIETECVERHIKIGVAWNVAGRLSALQGACPYRLRLLKRVPGAADQERILHKRFAKDRLTGEWFKRSTELLDLISSLEGTAELEPQPQKPGLEPLPESYFDDLLAGWRTPDGAPPRTHEV